MSTETEVKFRVQTFGSGTMIVSRDVTGDPWYTVFGPGGEDETKAVHNRYRCCIDVCAYLNGGPRPLWLDDLKKCSAPNCSESHVEDVDRTAIFVCGPLIDRCPPTCDWVTDESNEAKKRRREFMERLFPDSNS